VKRTITLDVNHTTRYDATVIKTFKRADTEALSKGRRVKRFVSIESVARRKLRQLQIAGRLEDLRVPPGNRLGAPKGEHAGRHSIRVTDQFRACFRWTAAGTEDVEIVDYH
jgi:proteic killer suppression protein